MIFLCGHYEGIDERVLEEIVTDYVSIGDYVLTGGELAACVMIDAISRFVPGVLNNEESSQFESMQDNLLEYPHYTRPEIWHEKQVPQVLLKGDHDKIQSWRLEQSMKRTRERRPDLLAQNRPVTVAYFSPTEGTRKAAELLAMGLTQNPRYLDLTRRKFRKQIRRFQEQELLVAAAPVYGGQLPRLEEGLFTNLRGNHTPCVLMAAYGNRHYDDTLAQMKEILTSGDSCVLAPLRRLFLIFIQRSWEPDVPMNRIEKSFADFLFLLREESRTQRTKALWRFLCREIRNQNPRL